jgi:hypothetical protein
VWAYGLGEPEGLLGSFQKAKREGTIIIGINRHNYRDLIANF